MPENGTSHQNSGSTDNSQISKVEPMMLESTR